MKTILYNAKILSMNSENSNIDSVLVEDKKIKAVGKYKELCDENDEMRKINLDGKILLPGFIDTHTHFFEFAKRKISVNLEEAKDLEEFKQLLINFRNTNKFDFSWVGGGGWNPNFIKYEGFNKKILDDVFPDIPVSLESRDMHSKLCNTAALKAAKISKNTPDPFGGKIHRLEDGEPSGLLFEQAWELIEKVKPSLSKSDMKYLIKEGIKKLHKMGITAVHVMENADLFKIYSEVVREEKSMRFFWHFPAADLDDIIEKALVSYSGDKDEFLKICGMKIFMDGSLGSQTAYMYKPYKGTESYGDIPMTEDELRELCEKAAEKGISPTIHAIGDKCNNLVIRVLSNLKDKYPDLFPRIEHLQCIRKEDLGKLKENNIYCAVQPIHIKADIENIKKLIPHSENNCYIFKDLLDKGITLGFGSDAPVETINPFLGIYAAIERKIDNNPKYKSWLPEQMVTREQALKAYTIDAAKGSKSENKLGSIQPGKFADLIVIDDFENKSNEFWLNAESYLTMIHGKIVYDKL